MDMLENHLACRETVRKYWGTKNKAEEDLYRSTVKSWKHIYLEERADGLMKSRQGKRMGRPPKTDIKMPRSTFYYYMSHPIKDKYECEKQEIVEIFKAHK